MGAGFPPLIINAVVPVGPPPDPVIDESPYLVPVDLKVDIPEIEPKST